MRLLYEHSEDLFCALRFVILCLPCFSERVAVGRALDLPVYFGDAGSREVSNNYHTEF